MIPFTKISVGEEEKKAVCDVIDSGWIAPGKEVEAFQKEFADYVGVKHAFFTNSGTSALKMAYKYFSLVRGKESFYCMKNTYPATWMAGLEMGMERKDYWNSDIRTGVAYGGLPCKYVFEIEDRAHRIERNDHLCLTDIAIYSFYATKNMTTGQGGMVCTNVDDIAEELLTYIKDGFDVSSKERHTMGKTYEILVPAGGYDGNDISASIGREQLKKLPRFNERRQEIIDIYNDAFGYDWKGKHLYPVFNDRVHNIYDIRKWLQKCGISTGYHYPNTGWTGISLPIYPDLTDDEARYISEQVKRCPHLDLQEWNPKLIEKMLEGNVIV